MITAAAIIAACAWTDPGADPYRGSVPAAVETYTDIPAPVRARLRARMERRQFNDVATIRRDSIEGRGTSYAELRDMHFGRGKVCRTVDRRGWKPEHAERGLIYCDSGHCLIVPTVCNNVARVTRIRTVAELPAVPMLAALPAPGLRFAPAPSLPIDELAFDPPGAGPAEASSFAMAAAAPAPRAADWALMSAIVPPTIQPWAGVPPPPVPGIPEPGTWALMAAGLAMLAWRRLAVKEAADVAAT